MLQALVPDLDRAVDRHIEKVAVMRDQDVPKGIVRADTPPASCASPDRDGSSARRAAAGWAWPAAVSPAQCASASRPRTRPSAAPSPSLLKPKPGQHRPHLRIQRVPIQRVKALLQHRVALRRRLVLSALHGRVRPAAPPAARSRLSIARSSSKTDRHSSKHRAAAEPQPLLRQIADGHARASAACAP